MINYHGLGILTNPSAGSHIVKVCQNSVTQAAAVTHFIKKGLFKGEAVIIISTLALRKAVIFLMEKLGLDVQCLKEKDQIKFLDVEYILSDLLVNDELDPQTFKRHIRSPIQAVKIKYDNVRVFGEMSGVLSQQGLHDKATQLEDLLDELLISDQFSMFCTYSLDNLDPDYYDESLERICMHHTHHVSAKRTDLNEPEKDKVALRLFYAAWNRIMDKIAQSTKKLNAI